jgi:pectinesterase
MLIVLTGDSTVSDQEGWGTGFAARLVPGAECVNLAQCGRSSKSYRAEGFWEEAVASQGDYLFIQFGHNDQPGKGPDRETDPETSFAANLARYVTEARTARIQPVLITSLTRRRFDADGRLHDTLGPWVAATRRVAAETATPLIDLHRASTDLSARFGPDRCAELSLREPDGAVDISHLNEAGALVFGGVVADLARESVPGLKPWLAMA